MKNKELRICYLSNISCYIQSWVKFFIERGWEVHVISRHPERRKLHPRAKKYKLPINPYFAFPLHLFLIYKWIRKIRPILVHAQNMQAYGIYAAIRNVPLIIHEGGPEHMKTSKGLQRLLEIYAYKRADLITTEVEENKTVIAREYNIEEEKIISILWGVDLSIFHRNYSKEVHELRRKLNISPEDFVMIFTRRLTPFYGAEQNLYVLNEVKKEFPNVKLILFKHGVTPKYFKKIKWIINKLNLSNNVIIEDEVPREKIPIYLNLSDLALNLLEEDNGSSAIAEQMACGCIVLGTNCRGYRGRIINGKNGFLVEDRNDIKTIAEIIKKCIQDPSIKERFYKYNKRYVEKYENWTVQMQKMEKIYLDLIKR